MGHDLTPRSAVPVRVRRGWSTRRIAVWDTLLVVLIKAWRWLGRGCQPYVLGVLALSILSSIGIVTGHDAGLGVLIIATLPTGLFVYPMAYVAGATAFTVLGSGLDPSTATAAAVMVPILTVAFTLAGLTNAVLARAIWLAIGSCRVRNASSANPL
jgi:hypothetical protein